MYKLVKAKTNMSFGEENAVNILKGDFIPMIQQFNAAFEMNDLFYGLRSLAFKFGRSTFVSPNPNLMRKIKVDLFLESLNKLNFGIN